MRPVQIYLLGILLEELIESSKNVNTVTVKAWQLCWKKDDYDTIGEREKPCNINNFPPSYLGDAGTGQKNISHVIF